MGLTFFPAQGDNLPTGWSQAVQQAAGNTQSDQMLKIALAGYPIPQLYMAPVSVFTQVGGSVPVACVTGQNAAGAGVLTRPAAFTITWALAGQGGQLGPYLKGSKQDPPANVTLNFVPQLPDVSVCVWVWPSGTSMRDNAWSHVLGLRLHELYRACRDELYRTFPFSNAQVACLCPCFLHFVR